MGSPQREVGQTFADVTEQFNIIRRALERGKKRAEDGCVASESLDVFIHCLDELQRLRNAVLG